MAKTHSSAAVRRAPAPRKTRSPKTPRRPVLAWTNPSAPPRRHFNESEWDGARFALIASRMVSELRGRRFDPCEMQPIVRQYWIWEQNVGVRHG